MAPCSGGLTCKCHSTLASPEEQIDPDIHLVIVALGILMKAVVLAGGYATRLRPISYSIPKLLFPILGKPMIYWTLDLLRKHGVDEVVLAVNYLADSLMARVGKEHRGMRIRYSLEDEPLGTGGPVKLASHTIRLDDTFIAMNGDVIADVDLTEMLKRHKSTKAMVTDALHEVRDPTRFGVVQLDPAYRIERFVEKPRLREAPSRMVNAGIYMIEPSVLRMIPPRRKVSLEREIFPVLARRRKLTGFPFREHWFDIGSLPDYQKANFEMLREQGGRTILGNVNSRLVAGSRLIAPMLFGTQTKIEKTARVGPNALLGKHCLIGRGAQVRDSILFDRVAIGKGAKISGAIIASDVSVGEGAVIESGAVISSNVRIRDGVMIGRNAIVHPHKEIDTNVGTGVHVM
jgi:mannose-1-phosphate guanylyltransferase